MNSFANPEDALSYTFPEFPKPEGAVTPYSNVDGVLEYHLNDFNAEGAVYVPSEASAPVVQPALFQDFKEVLPPNPA